jgi:autotransporter passenger strand-loop-strand repeat protein
LKMLAACRTPRRSIRAVLKMLTAAASLYLRRSMPAGSKIF